MTLHKDKASALKERAESSRTAPHLDEALWVITQKFLDKINGPIPNEPPPLVGEALAAAEARNAELED